MTINEKLSMSRRSFLAAAAASAATLGVAGTGLVGCSEAETEKAPTQDEWIPTVCGMCFNMCGIKAHVVDGVVMELKGNPDGPWGGHICGKGAAGIMQLYDPHRITKPMKRTNPEKGVGIDPGWEEITWDEAYEIMVEKVNASLAKGPGRILATGMVASLNGSFTMSGGLAGAFGAQYVGPDICGAGVHNVSYIFSGSGNAGPDYKYCKYLLQFGTQAGTATRHGLNVIAEQFAESRDNGLKLVNFDPRMSAGAANADEWVPIRPGTDAAAALGIAQVLVNELELVDFEYLKNRANGPALVNVETGRILRQAETNKALYMDADGSVKPWDEVADPQLEGAFEVEGVACKTAYTMLREHLKTYTPEYVEGITTIPADTLRRIAKEFGEAAQGGTIEIDGVTLDYRPAAADAFSGVSRHKHSMLSHWAIYMLNVLVGSCNSAGGALGYAPMCNGWTAENPHAAFKPAIWEEDGFICSCDITHGGPMNEYAAVRNNIAAPTDLKLSGLTPLSHDPHFVYLTQKNPELYGTTQADLLINYGENTLKNWGNMDEQAEFLKTFEYIIGIDIYMNDTSYYFDLFVPEANYLERYEHLPHTFNCHRTPAAHEECPWTVAVHQPVVEARDGAPGHLDISAELAHRTGTTAGFLGVFNYLMRVKEEYAAPVDQKLDPTVLIDSIYKSLVDEEHDLEWFKKNGIYTYPRTVQEIYPWQIEGVGKVPLYWDFMLEAKEKIEAVLADLDFYWETDDYQALPDWKPCCDHEIEDPAYDLFPVYYTDAVNYDSWGVNNPYLNELNAANEIAYRLEVNPATAAAKGLADGDAVVLSTRDGVSIEGVVAVSEFVHPETIGALVGMLNSRSEFLPISKGAGFNISHLIPGFDPKRLDHVSTAFDQCIRVKLEKK